MSDTDEGLRIAREHIAEEGSARTGFLDLGNLGLNELPAELFTLKHLRSLNLGTRMHRDFLRRVVRSRSRIAPNRIDAQISRLAMLPELVELSVAGTPLRTLAGIAELRALQHLDCSDTQVADLTPLAEVSALQSLYCRATPARDFSPLAKANALKLLHCGGTQVSDLSPLAGLRALQSLYCWRTEISDLSPLAEVMALEHLYCGGTRINELAPLTELKALQYLDLWGTLVSDLSPLAKLDVLRSLRFHETQVKDLAPLAGLNALQHLSFSNTPVKDLAPLAGLNALKELYFSNTRVEDLSPIAGLAALETLDCSGCSFKETFEELWRKPCLTKLFLFGTHVPGVPADVLSQEEYANCLESLRAHLADLSAGAVAVSDIKLMVLGNGRVGKTQICRRLRGEDYDPNVSSTHGDVRIRQASAGQPA